MQTKDWFSVRPTNYWYVLVRDPDNECWSVKPRLDKATAVYVQSQHTLNGEEAVLGFGRPFPYFP